MTKLRVGLGGGIYESGWRECGLVKSGAELQEGGGDSQARAWRVLMERSMESL